MITRLIQILIPTLLIAFSSSPAQVSFERTYGGGLDDGGRAVLETPGGYIILGYTKSFGAGLGDIYWIETDSAGELRGTRTFGSSGDEDGYSVEETQDGGYVICGYTTSSGAGGNDVLLIKTDSSGAPVWSKTYGGGASDLGYAARQTQDGGYVIAGITESFGSGGQDAYLIKTDASGNMSWSKTFGGAINEGAYRVLETPGGGYVLAGYTNSFGSGGLDVYLIRTNPSGAMVWSKTYGGNNADGAYAVEGTQDGGYIVAGYTNSFGAGRSDVYIIKTDSSGVETWSQTFGGEGHDQAYSVRQRADGGYIIAGTTESFGAGEYDVYLIRTDGSGIAVWENTYGGTGMDGGRDVQLTRDGGYSISGTTASSGAGGVDVYLVKTDADGAVGIQPDGRRGGPSLPGAYALSQNFPNPFNPSTTIVFGIPGTVGAEQPVNLTIYDIRGRRVKELVNSNLEPGTHTIHWDGRNDRGQTTASGIYMYRLKAGDETFTRKMTVLK